jgi:hypothetical protein
MQNVIDGKETPANRHLNMKFPKCNLCLCTCKLQNINILHVAKVQRLQMHIFQFWNWKDKHLNGVNWCILINIVFIQKHKLRGKKVVYLGKCVWEEDSSWNMKHLFAIKLTWQHGARKLPTFYCKWVKLVVHHKTTLMTRLGG